MTEPIMAVVKLIRAQVADPYTTRNSLPVLPDWPKVGLNKVAYPRISVSKVTAKEESVAIGNLTEMEEEITLDINLWFWCKTGDTQILTISSTKYSEGKLRDYFTKVVKDELRNHWYTDTNTTGYYDYIVNATRNIDFDEDEGIMRTQIEIGFKRMNVS